MSREKDPTNVPAILHSDTGKRLDAIIRRHGGKPKPDASATGKVQFPPLGKRECEDQLSLLDDGEAGTEATA